MWAGNYNEAFNAYRMSESLAGSMWAGNYNS